MLELRGYFELDLPRTWAPSTRYRSESIRKNFGAMPPSAYAWRAPGAETKRPHGARWLHDGSRVQNRQTTRTRPCNSELKRTDRSPIKDSPPGGLMSLAY